MAYDDVWHVPGLQERIRGGGVMWALAVGSSVALMSFVLGVILSVIHPWGLSEQVLEWTVVAAAVVLMGILLAVAALPWWMWLLSGAVYAAPWIESAIRGKPIVYFWAYLLGYAVLWFFGYALSRDRGSPAEEVLDARLRWLSQYLPGWKAYLPQTGAALARVLVSPANETFLVGITGLRVEVEYGQVQHTGSGLDAKALRALARQDTPLVQRGQQVLWLVPRIGDNFRYAPSLDGGVTVIIAEPEVFARHLHELNEMCARLTEQPTEQPTAAPSASAHGRAVEQQAIAELKAVLATGWTLKSNILLAKGGDADIELVAPSDQRYVIDVKSRTDHFDLAALKGDRMKSWQEIHDQVVLAARQRGAVPLIWQPCTRDQDTAQVGTVWCQRGDARALMRTLAGLETAPHPADSSPPHEVLGVSRHASHSEIRAAYKTLAKQYHPDRVASLGQEFRDLAEQKMKAINAAYELLLGQQASSGDERAEHAHHEERKQA